MFWSKKNPEVTQTESVATGASTNPSDNAVPETTETAEAPKKQKAMARRVLNHLLGRYLGTALYLPYVALKTLTVSPTIKPVSLIWNSVAEKSFAKKWMTRLAIAVPAAVVIPTVIQPLTYRAAFLAATHESYDCKISRVETKVYPYPAIEEAMINPILYAAGYQNSFMNNLVPVFARKVGNDSISKTLVNAMCGAPGSNDFNEAKTFEVTDTAYRLSERFRSNDIVTRIGVVKPDDVMHFEVIGVRNGVRNLTPNVWKAEVK